MRLDHLPGAPHLTYCTNIHAGESWADIAASLAHHLPPIKAAVAPDRKMGLGLRLSGIAADALIEPATLDAFKRFLADAGVYVFTINAFPFGPFHGVRVKEEVYQPDWTTAERVRFTNRAADILAALLPAGLTGSVSTVPGTFKPLASAPGAVDAMTRNYVDHAAHLVRLERATSKHIALSIEPEPCCFLETIEETVRYFTEHLFGPAACARLAEATGLDAGAARVALGRHLGVCYDVCHAAVEFEDPLASLRALDDAGIAITKLQLSSALAVPAVTPESEALLQRFDEGVYLHQTIERRDGRLTRHVDLQEAFAALRRGEAGGEWRVHCHVPVFLETLDRLGTTQGFLVEILEECRRRPVSPHLEAETYTWDVLPPAFAGEDKAASIARELDWVKERLAA
jgi:sugar phosphate isomerase/epimerase